MVSLAIGAREYTDRPVPLCDLAVSTTEDGGSGSGRELDRGDDRARGVQRIRLLEVEIDLVEAGARECFGVDLLETLEIPRVKLAQVTGRALVGLEVLAGLVDHP